MENGGVIIATASATALSKPGNILLWQWKSTEKQDVVGEQWSLLEMIDMLFKVVIMMAAGAYFLQQGTQAVRSLGRDVEIGSVKAVVSNVRNMGEMGNVGSMIEGMKKVVRDAQASDQEKGESADTAVKSKEVAVRDG